MYTSEQVVELVATAYEQGFNDGARNAYDTVEFIYNYGESSVGETSDTVNEAGEPDATEYDGLYLEVVGQKADDALERLAALERWAYGTPREETREDVAKCRCSC